MRAALLAAGLFLFPALAWAANCAVTEDLKQVAAVVAACNTEIDQAGDTIFSDDPAVKRQAARRIADAVRVLDSQTGILNNMSGRSALIQDAKTNIQRIKESFQVPIEVAGEVMSAPAPSPTGPNEGDKNDKKGEGGDADRTSGAAGGKAIPGSKDGDAGAYPEGSSQKGNIPGSDKNASKEGLDRMFGHGESQNADAAVSRARGAAQTLKEDRGDGGPLPPGSGRPGRGSSPGSGALKQTSPAAGPAPASAGSSQELLALAPAASLRQAGLKIGDKGQLLRADDLPAGPDDMARLRDQIAKDPEALRHRPDFFDALGGGAGEEGGRASLNRLISDFKTMPEERDNAFKHIGLTAAERDFDHTATCNKNLDKDCNAVVKSRAYKKGRFVSPEDLKAIDEALRPKFPASGSPKTAAVPGESARQEASGEPTESRPAPAWSVFGSRLRALLGGARRKTRAVERGPASEASAPEPEEPNSPGVRRPWFRPWQAVVVVLLIAIWLYDRRRRQSFMER